MMRTLAVWQEPSLVPLTLPSRALIFSWLHTEVPPPPRVPGPRLDLTKKGAGLYLRLSLAIEILNTRLVTFYDVRG